MGFDLDEAVSILGRTPAVLAALLRGLPEPWIRADEGPGRWSPFDVLGHLIHGERTDWIPRLRILLWEGETRPFDPFDRFAQLEANRDRSLDELLDTFAELRRQNLETLAGFEITPEDYARTGRHPELGVVTLGELLACWAAHDLGHLAQISRAMAKRYRDEVGPWREHLPILEERE